MASYYVYHGGSGTGTSWATAYTTLTLAFSGHAAGDIYYVAHDHAESTASAVTLTSNGTLVAPTIVLCVNRAGTVPPVSADLRTTATVSTTGASNIAMASSTYYYGVKFQAGSAANAANVTLGAAGGTTQIYESCGFTLNNTSNTSRVVFSSAASAEIRCLNCTFTFSASATQAFGGVNIAFAATILGGSVVGAGPSTLFQSTLASYFTLIGVDLSAYGSGKTLFNNAYSKVLVQDCKLGASVAVIGATVNAGQEIFLVRSDSGDTNYRQEKHQYSGVLTTETTIVRTGGATDGTTPISWKIATSANSEWVAPFDCMPRIVWNETTGSRTITIYGAWAGGAVPLNDEIWFEVAYLGTTGFPLALIATTNKANYLATGASVSSDSSTWGGSIATKFKMSTTVTINEKGPLMVVVKAAKVSSTFYVDPEIELT